MAVRSAALNLALRLRGFARTSSGDGVITFLVMILRLARCPHVADHHVPVAQAIVPDAVVDLAKDGLRRDRRAVPQGWRQAGVLDVAGHVGRAAESHLSDGRGPAAEPPASSPGRLPIAGASSTTIGGGGSNRVEDNYGTVGGGQLNEAGDDTDADPTTQTYATVGGGYSNEASAQWTTIGGGRNNEASNTTATVSGGQNNVASGNRAVIAGGNENTAKANLAQITVDLLEKNEGRDRTIAMIMQEVKAKF